MAATSDSETSGACGADPRVKHCRCRHPPFGTSDSNGLSASSGARGSRDLPSVDQLSKSTSRDRSTIGLGLVFVPRKDLRWRDQSPVGTNPRVGRNAPGDEGTPPAPRWQHSLATGLRPNIPVIIELTNFPENLRSPSLGLGLNVSGNLPNRTCDTGHRHIPHLSSDKHSWSITSDCCPREYVEHVTQVLGCQQAYSVRPFRAGKNARLSQMLSRATSQKNNASICV